MSHEIHTNIDPTKFEKGDVLKMKNGRLRIIKKVSSHYPYSDSRQVYIALHRVVPHPTRNIAAYLWTDLKDKVIQHIKLS